MQEYKIAYADSPDVLDDLVNKSLVDGFVPQGGISVSATGEKVSFKLPDGTEVKRDGIVLFQALYREINIAGTGMKIK